MSKRDYKSSNHLLVTDGGGLAFRKSRRAHSVDGDETWVEGDHANTLNSFDGGDVRATHAVIAFGRTQGIDIQPSDKFTPTLRVGGSGAAIAHGVSASDDEVAGTLCTNSQGGQRTTDIAGAYVTETFPIDDGRDRQQRPAVAQVSPTLTKYNLDSRSPQSEEQQRIVSAVHDATMSVRRLTPTECERLMGWPDNWTAPPGIKAPDSKRYAACGDGIVAPVAYWIADRIKMIEGES